MKNYKLVVQYEGTRYSGFAKQGNTDNTIQEKLENVINRMLELPEGESVEVIGAGRTDAGVHARAMVCNVSMDTLYNPVKIMEHMNKYLPDDIVVIDTSVVSDRFHSRLRASGKTYRYTCYVGKARPVFDRKLVYTLTDEVDIRAMQAAANKLIGTHDYTSFCGNTKFKKSAVRTVDKIDIVRKGDYLTLTFHGNGFLQNMVRILTGTLLEVGKGERTVDSMTKILEAKNRAEAGFMAPACGLTLMEVNYS